MVHKDMLYVKCRKCGANVATGIVMSRGTNAVLKRNVSGPCQKCGAGVAWHDTDAFYEDGTKFIK